MCSRAHGHVVAQVVEAELGVGAVRDVGGIGGAPVLWRHHRLDAAHLEAQEAIDLAHPLGVAARQVVVDRDQMGAPAGDAVEIHGHGRHEGLAFAGLHLGDVALVQHDGAHDLHVEGTHVQGTLGALAGDGEGLEQHVVERLPARDPLLELRRAGAQPSFERALTSGSRAVMVATCSWRSFVRLPSPACSSLSTILGMKPSTPCSANESAGR